MERSVGYPESAILINDESQHGVEGLEARRCQCLPSWSHQRSLDPGESPAFKVQHGIGS